MVGPGSHVGPYARLRPGAKLDRSAKVGNFVEIKSAAIGEGAKVSHLTYIGDAIVGAGANIGAGTVTCNYDGFGKYRTEIGAGAFIGSNSALVAPVKVGQGAFVGSGSVITDDVPDDALALGRGRQVVKEGWAVTVPRRDRRPSKRLGNLDGRKVSSRASSFVRHRFGASNLRGGTCAVSLASSGSGPVAEQIVEALKRLEYRGYDSAGIATLEGGVLTRRRAPGKLKNLELRLHNNPLEGRIGIGHTRWATHGKPSETNAHPHASEKLAVVHNGIIENFRELARRAEGQGPPLRDRDRHGSRDPSGHRGTARRPEPQRGRGGRLAAAQGRLRAGLRVRRLRRPSDRRPPRRTRWRSATARARCISARTPWHWRPSPTRSAIWRRATGSSSGGRARTSTTRRTGASAGCARRAPPAPSWSTRATTATSWRRRSTNSRRSWGGRSPITSTCRPAAWRCPSPCRSTRTRSSGSRSRPAARRISPASRPNIGSSGWRGCRSTSTSRRSSATARRRCRRTA